MSLILFMLVSLSFGIGASSYNVDNKHFWHVEDIGVMQQGKSCIELPITCDVRSCQTFVCNKNKVKGVTSCMLNNLCCCSPRS
ncbi:hypothetical protein BVRB_4g089670 [Beta vulgaris subsp. vulgaris]|nr:hypothetical protein BVRB_4g089670 [Beta vulgaris subsp. vulgaris]